MKLITDFIKLDRMAIADGYKYLLISSGQQKRPHF